jgi:hypothetical protein|nr:MAG: hypothetical protein DIU57_17990 [Pseudomonadota bacterium]
MSRIRITFLEHHSSPRKLITKLSQFGRLVGREDTVNLDRSQEKDMGMAERAVEKPMKQHGPFLGIEGNSDSALKLKALKLARLGKDKATVVRHVWFKSWLQ